MRRSTFLENAAAASPVPQPRSMARLKKAGFSGPDPRRQHRLEQQIRSPIAELADQRGLEPRRILIEQCLYVGRWHRRYVLGAEPHQMQAGAVPILGVGGVRVAKRRHGRLALAELPADLAEGKPGRGKFRRQLDCLKKQIGGGGQIALQLQIAREFVAAVGHQIAGGLKQSRGHASKSSGEAPAMHQRGNSLERWIRGSSRMTAKKSR